MFSAGISAAVAVMSRSAPVGCTMTRAYKIICGTLIISGHPVLMPLMNVPLVAMFVFELQCHP